jgi:predicted unusual protein kinase regulating ubiquinone biosynthesis (AarF/ABC1/UbiB family)
MCIYIYNHYIDPVVPEQAPKFNIVPAPQTAFQHPLNDSSTLYTAYFYVTRMMELGWAFLPFIGYTLALLLTGGITEARRGRWMEVLVQCIEKSGCAFLKFGQWLSMRPDIFPLDVINVLARLRDNAPSHRFRDTVRIVEEEFQAPIAEVFDEFPSEPVASGSIAQVYKCRLTEAWAVKAGMLDANGDLIRDVAVKVRHPKVMNETWIDVDLIYAAIALTPQLCIPFSKEEFRNMMQNQIDFRWEAHFLSRFASNFSDEIAQRFIDFPRVSNALLREAVLVESWAEGRSVSDIFTEVGDMFRPINEAAKLNERQIDRSDVELGAFLARKAKQAGKFIKDEVEDGLHWALKKLGFDVDRFYTKQHLRVGEDRYVYDASLTPEENNVRAKKKVLAFTLFDMYLKMFLRDNLIHGDLHAGNVLFNMNNHVATVLDAGMTVSLEGDIMSKFGFFLKAICEGDADLLIKHVKEFEVNLPGLPKGSGHGKLSAYPEVLDSFSRNIHEIFEKFYKKSVYGNEIPEQVSIGDVVGQVLLALEKEKLEIRGDVASAILSMSVIEGILRQLDPDLDIILKSVVYFMKYKEVTDFGTILK